MNIELIVDHEGLEIYGLVEHGSLEDRVLYEGSKTEVLSFYLGMVGPQAEA